MRNTKSIVTRSGRFPTAGSAQTVITASRQEGRVYRFHNTSRRDSVVISVGGTDTTLAVGDSIDLLVGTHAVSVSGGEGVYDLLRPDQPVRSGKIRRLGGKGNVTVTIAMLGTVSRIYRIVNAGEHVLTIAGNDIQTKASLDVEVTGDVTVTGTDPEGVFDLLAEA